MQSIPMVRRWLAIGAAASLLSVCTACPAGERESAAPQGSVETAPAAKGPAMKPPPDDPTTGTQSAPKTEDLMALAGGINQMGFNLQKQLAGAGAGKNLFISPASVSLALAMTWEGSAGPTRDAMTAALELNGIPAPQVGSAFQELMKRLTSQDERIQIRVANSLWARLGIEFRQDYLTRVRSAYSAMVTALNFADKASPGRINQWVGEQTEGRIPKIVDSIPSDAILYLINAIWFKGEWTDPFKPELTKPQPFHTSAQSAKDHPLMSRTGEWDYWEGEGMQIAGLPYGKGAMRMIVILPAEGSDLAALMGQMDWPALKGWLARMGRRDGELALPKFKMEYETSLRAPLAAMGMGLAFSDAADFSGMVAPPTRAAISEVKHKTFVDVNEQGTEAAAVTSVQIRATRARAPQPPFRMIVDRPFFCAIQDRRTGVLLFMGAIYEPEL